MRMEKQADDPGELSKSDWEENADCVLKEKRTPAPQSGPRVWILEALGQV